MSRLVYILAASHSGSTLLAMLLGSHPEACTVGELNADLSGAPDDYRCSCGQRIKECDFWRKVRDGMIKKGFPDYDVKHPGTNIFRQHSPYVRRLLAPLPRSPFWETARDFALSLSAEWREHLENTQIRNAALVEVVLEVSGAKIIVDSSKHPLRLKYLLRNPALDVKVIRLVRDGRAVAVTYTDEWNLADASDPLLRGGGTGIWRPPPRRNIAEAAREWRRSNESADCVIDKLSEKQRTRLRYEDLCKNPAAELKQLCEFLEIDPDGINLNFRSRQQHVIGNGMRLDASSEIRLDDRWTTNLSSDQLRAFEASAHTLNRRYGYE